jgi:nucleoside 2-deoxyribosyltransferase
MTGLKAFVLMSFDPEYDPVYAQLIEPALTESGFTVTRADLSTNQQQILKDIINSLADADLVIADVSGLNGNVMYELGLAHGMGKRTVMITRTIAELPFDLRPYRATEYSTEFHEAGKLKDRLREIAMSVADGTAEFSNPVLDFAPEFLGKAEQVATVPNRASGEVVVPGAAPEAELGLLDYSIQLSESSGRLTDIAEKLGNATVLIGTQVEARGEQITRTNKNLGTKAAPVLRTLMRETAAEFDSFAEDLERLNPELVAELKLVASSANGIARLRSGSTEDEKIQIASDIAAFENAELSFTQAFGNIDGFAKVLAGLPSMEQQLTAAVRRATSAVNATAEALELGRSEFARVRGLLEERLQD